MPRATVSSNMTGKKDGQIAYYDTADSLSTYGRDEGILVIPLAGDGTPGSSGACAVQVHSPYGFRKVHWDVAKRGTPPVVPTPQDSISGDMLLTSDLTWHQPRADSTSQSLSFAASGVYTYLQSISGTGGVCRGKNDFYETAGFPFQTPMLDFNGYVDIAVGAVIGGIGSAALTPEARLELLESRIAAESNAIVAHLVKGDDYVYQSSIVSGVFFNDELIP